MAGSLALGTADELENADADASFVSKVPDPNFDDSSPGCRPNMLKTEWWRRTGCRDARPQGPLSAKHTSPSRLPPA